jgi:peptide/nickel transport system permease protein
MWAYILRRLLYNIPVYLGIILLLMALLRVNNPVYAYLGKSPSDAQIAALTQQMGLDRPFLPISITFPKPETASRLAFWKWDVGFHHPRRTQYGDFLIRLVRLDFSEPSWEQKRPVGSMLKNAVGPSLSVTVPTLIITASLAISIALISAFTRGRATDRTLMIFAVIGMSISVLVFIILGQYFGAYWLNGQLDRSIFAISGYQPWIRWSSIDLGALTLFERSLSLGIPYPSYFRPQIWAHYCLLPVLIGVVVSMGYDTRFYRAVMVEECNRDYIVTARAKGATEKKIMFVHMLKNAMIPVITRIMITLPFLIVGSILIEYYFNIPGMGRTLITAINSKDFPVIQAFTAVFAAVVIASNILTDVLYALVDPRVRLS